MSSENQMDSLKGLDFSQILLYFSICIPPFEKGGTGGIQNPPKSPFRKGGLVGGIFFRKGGQKRRKSEIRKIEINKRRFDGELNLSHRNSM